MRAIEAFLAAPPYQACLLLVHADPARLGAAVAAVGVRYGRPAWALGRSLGPRLLDHAPADRPAVAVAGLSEAVAAHAPGPVLISDIPLLFEPTLRLDPLRLLRDAARRAPLLVAWPGAVEGDRLVYAVAGHAHYRSWPLTDLCPTCVIPL